MPVNLYDLSVTNYMQTLGAVKGILQKGLTFFQENGIDPETVVETRIFPDMLPFRFQIQSVIHHSVGTLDAFGTGVFRPSRDPTPHTYAELQGLVANAFDTVKSLSPETINGFEGKEIAFEFKDSRLPFTAETFVMSFSLPNLHFHATTAYGILRARGVPVGKRDYLGRLQLKA